MIIEKIICDCCSEEIPIVKGTDMFGIEREFYKRGRLDYGGMLNFKDDGSILGLDLCEECARKIDMAMLLSKYELNNTCYSREVMVKLG